MNHKYLDKPNFGIYNSFHLNLKPNRKVIGTYKFTWFFQKNAVIISRVEQPKGKMFMVHIANRDETIIRGILNVMHKFVYLTSLLQDKHLTGKKLEMNDKVG